MKRYRVLHSDYDYRANLLKMVPTEEWDQRARQVQEGNFAKIVAGLQAQYGTLGFNAKLKNFVDLGARPDSVLAFHNRFMVQVRDAFVVGAYYPALTSACALGERILNHLMLALRNDYRGTPAYKAVYRKEQFDDWGQVIDTLTAWTVFRPEVAEPFRRLAKLRNVALHFNVETERNDRAMALEAVTLLAEVVDKQFGGFGSHPWFIPNDAGMALIRKEAESHPFIRQVYLPNCAYVGPRHNLVAAPSGGWSAADDFEYEDRGITDEEYVELYKSSDHS